MNFEEPELLQHYYLLIRKHIEKIPDVLLGKSSTTNLMEILTRIVILIAKFRRATTCETSDILLG